MTEVTKRQATLQTLATRGWVSLNQFALIAGVSYVTVLKMRDRGDFKAIPIGGVFRVYAEEVERFLTEGNRKSGEGDSSESPSTNSNTSTHYQP